MLTTILLKHIGLLKKSLVATVNENLLYQCVPPVLGVNIKERHFARWVTRLPSKEFPPDDHIRAEKEELRKPKNEKLNKSSSQFISKDRPISKDHTPTAKPVHAFENGDYIVLDENDYTFR